MQGVDRGKIDAQNPLIVETGWGGGPNRKKQGVGKGGGCSSKSSFGTNRAGVQNHLIVMN